MKKYKVPPRIVRDVLLATFLLLGELDLDELVRLLLLVAIHLPLLALFPFMPLIREARKPRAKNMGQ